MDMHLEKRYSFSARRVSLNPDFNISQAVRGEYPDATMEDFHTYHRMVTLGFRLADGKIPNFEEFLELLYLEHKLKPKTRASFAIPLLKMEQERRLSTPIQQLISPLEEKPLQEFKSSPKSFNQNSVKGNALEFAQDQQGSRLIQQLLDEDNALLEELKPHVSELMVNIFGNYVVQKMLEMDSSLYDVVVGRVEELSFHPFGCRVIQKLLELNPKLVLNELKNIEELVIDSNGNHVIQKCIESQQDIKFILQHFEKKMVFLATHPYGSRAIQRVFQHIPLSQNQDLLEEVLKNASELVTDQYGNYALQHILEKGSKFEVSRIIIQLKSRYVELSKHKFASNVLEKCVIFASEADLRLIFLEFQDILPLVKDKFANYVVQRFLESNLKTEMGALIKPHLPVIRQVPYAKNLVLKVEKLY